MKRLNKNSHPIKLVVENTLVNLPTPTSISYIWNWGSMLGINLAIQILSGILLSSHYNSRVNLAFERISHIRREVNYGYIMRFLHINGARLFFILAFIHIRRGVNQSSFKYKYTWVSGVVIILILIATAFLGYVLPWGQMSFWGATVITNLLSAIPIVGEGIVKWLWGGFSIGMATLNRFFSLHFLLPFILRAIVLMHLASLHQTGSNQPRGVNPNLDKTPFHPYFSVKDIITAAIIIIFLVIVSILVPLLIGDPENFNPANPLNTPPHIQPEWYFLFAYAILRSIPNKLGGVVALIFSIVALVLLAGVKVRKPSKKFTPATKKMFWAFSSIFIILTYIGACPVEEPFEKTGKLIRVIYFMTIRIN